MSTGDKRIGVVMVDELQPCAPFAPKGQASRVFGKEKSFCHMTVDGDVELLHEVASKIGLRRAWFQDSPSAPHYDLTPSRREAALQAGAVFVPAREQAKARIAKRNEARKT